MHTKVTLTVIGFFIALFVRSIALGGVEVIPINPPPPGCDVIYFGSSVGCSGYGTVTGHHSNIIKYGPRSIPTTQWRKYGVLHAVDYENLHSDCTPTNPVLSMIQSDTFSESWHLSTTYTASIGLQALHKAGGDSISQTVGLTANMSSSYTYGFSGQFTYGNSQSYTVHPTIDPCRDYIIVPYVLMQDIIVEFGYWQSVIDFDTGCDTNGNGWIDTTVRGKVRCSLIEGAGYGSVMKSGVIAEDRGSHRIPNYAARCPCQDSGGGAGGDNDCGCSDDLPADGDEDGDEDGDGILNADDDTPFGYDGDDPTGDADGDGIPNADDASPYGYDGNDPDGDDDGDGIKNSQDPTPNGEEPGLDPALIDALLNQIDGLTRIA